MCGWECVDGSVWVCEYVSVWVSVSVGLCVWECGCAYVYIGE